MEPHQGQLSHAVVVERRGRSGREPAAGLGERRVHPGGGQGKPSQGLRVVAGPQGLDDLLPAKDGPQRVRHRDPAIEAVVPLL